ncbi:hypothetical protein VNO80_02928 [Phaseolus coccineus]|uniref:Uncharacterized protein n=1 Tax=Phaseolus coccineus TaxID=3886 RepID=A0AAN9NR99_PHACN
MWIPLEILKARRYPHYFGCACLMKIKNAFWLTTSLITEQGGLHQINICGLEFFLATLDLLELSLQTPETLLGELVGMVGSAGRGGIRDREFGAREEGSRDSRITIELEGRANLVT